jgi:hypothetical protein
MIKKINSKKYIKKFKKFIKFFGFILKKFYVKLRKSNWFNFIFNFNI